MKKILLGLFAFGTVVFASAQSSGHGRYPSNGYGNRFENRPRVSISIGAGHNNQGYWVSNKGYDRNLGNRRYGMTNMVRLNDGHVVSAKNWRHIRKDQRGYQNGYYY